MRRPLIPHTPEITITHKFNTLVKTQIENFFVYRNITKKQWFNKIRKETENGKIALERVQEKSPGVIFLDLMIPEMDGFEFIEELKKT